jgi:hypothetical protein
MGLLTNRVMKGRAGEVVSLLSGVRLEPLYRDQMVDCRLFLLGDRYRQLCRAYGELINRLSCSPTPRCPSLHRAPFACGGSFAKRFLIGGSSAVGHHHRSSIT